MGAVCLSFGVWVYTGGNDASPYLLAGNVLMGLTAICYALFTTAATTIRQLIGAYGPLWYWLLPVSGYAVAAATAAYGLDVLAAHDTTPGYVSGHVVTGIALVAACVSTVATASRRFLLIARNSKGTAADGPPPGRTQPAGRDSAGLRSNRVRSRRIRMGPLRAPVRRRPAAFHRRPGARRAGWGLRQPDRARDNDRPTNPERVRRRRALHLDLLGDRIRDAQPSPRTSDASLLQPCLQNRPRLRPDRAQPLCFSILSKVVLLALVWRRQFALANRIPLIPVGACLTCLFMAPFLFEANFTNSNYFVPAHVLTGLGAVCFNLFSIVSILEAGTSG